jgi:hypothetical protein
MNKKMVLVVIVMITLGTAIIAATTTTIQQQEVDAATSKGDFHGGTQTSIFENDVYVAWWTNKTGNDEVMYRLSSDAGKTFTDKANLSNTPNSDSVDVEISADEGRVAVSWWERNQTLNEPVIRISNDNGKTFGPVLKLASDGPIG